MQFSALMFNKTLIINNTSIAGVNCLFLIQHLIGIEGHPRKYFYLLKFMLVDQHYLTLVYEEYLVV